VVTDPTGRFAYAVAGEIWAFSINASNGTLTPVAGSPFAAGASAMSIDPGGHFAYVAEAAGINVYSIDVTTGALSATADSPAALNTPSALQIDPSGQFAYAVAISGANQTGVYAFSVDSTTGALTPVPGSPFAASSSPGNPVVVSITN
jgi:6-phosphogluconolactonase (cycloisomerase 2 family)